MSNNCKQPFNSNYATAANTVETSLPLDLISSKHAKISRFGNLRTSKSKNIQ